MFKRLTKRMVRLFVVFTVLATILSVEEAHPKEVYAASCPTNVSYAMLWSGPSLDGAFDGYSCYYNPLFPTSNGVRSIKFFNWDSCVSLFNASTGYSQIYRGGHGSWILNITGFGPGTVDVRFAC